MRTLRDMINGCLTNLNCPKCGGALNMNADDNIRFYCTDCREGFTEKQMVDKLYDTEGLAIYTPDLPIELVGYAFDSVRDAVCTVRDMRGGFFESCSVYGRGNGNQSICIIFNALLVPAEDGKRDVRFVPSQEELGNILKPLIEMNVASIGRFDSIITGSIAIDLVPEYAKDLRYWAVRVSYGHAVYVAGSNYPEYIGETARQDDDRQTIVVDTMPGKDYDGYDGKTMVDR